MTSIEQQGTYVNSNILCSQLNCIVSFLVVPRQTTVHMICTTFQILYTYFCIRSGLHISEKSSIIKLDNKNCVILRCIWSKHKRPASWSKRHVSLFALFEALGSVTAPAGLRDCQQELRRWRLELGLRGFVLDTDSPRQPSQLGLRPLSPPPIGRRHLLILGARPRIDLRHYWVRSAAPRAVWPRCPGKRPRASLNGLDATGG